MNRILIDTMHLVSFLKDDSHFDLLKAINDEKIAGMVSVISLTELIKILGREVEDRKRISGTIQRIISSNLILEPVNPTVAIRAGELRLKYDIPTADSLIAATGIVENVKHILTDDEHYEATKSLIKPIDLKAAMKLV
jgi:predicted nucleic acid-binding protein